MEESIMKKTSDTRIITKIMFRLLPVQILLAAVGAVNGIVSSYFASNYVGVDAMSAVGLYSPFNMLLMALATMMAGGAAILCGKYLGQNKQDRLNNVFSVDLAASALIAIVFTALFVVLSLFDLTGFITGDEAVRPLFNRYLLGQAIGVFPFILGNQLPAFLSLENREKRTMTASIIYIICNVLLNYLFVQVLGLEAFGLALASSIGLWIFLAVQAQYFFSKKAHLRASAKNLRWGESGDIIKTGIPGAASNGYQTLRGFILNHLIEIYVGSIGISAFAAVDNVMRIFWSVPIAMLAVSRLMISVSYGEEDRRTLSDIMRVMLKKYLPLMSVICIGIIACAEPMTRLFYQDPSADVYKMTVWGLCLIPICMPFSIIYMHYVCYGQASGKTVLVHILSLLDGVVCVAGFAALTIRFLGMNGVYLGSVFNGVVTTLVILLYAWIKNKRRPKNMDDLMAFPDSFGADESERMDLTVRSMDEVVGISQAVQRFCLEKGIDRRRAYLAGLSMEEMAGNIVDHGFAKDKKRHSIDVRVVRKDDDVILRLRDDCVPFDPGERQSLAESDDPSKNIGIRMVFKIARDVEYQNILGLNVLTVRI